MDLRRKTVRVGTKGDGVMAIRSLTEGAHYEVQVRATNGVAPGLGRARYGEGEFKLAPEGWSTITGDLRHAAGARSRAPKPVDGDDLALAL